LVTEARRLSRRPVLFYLFAEPSELGGRPIGEEVHRRHLTEIDTLQRFVDGDEVAFLSSSYRQWIDGGSAIADVKNHLELPRQRFGV